MPDKEELFEAIRTDDVGMVRRLIRQDASLARATNEQGVTALLYAKYSNRTAALDAMLEAGPELDIFEAAAIGDAGRLTELLEGDASLARAWSPDGFTPLHYAAFFGNEGIAGLLLPFGAEVNLYSRNSFNVMPLHSACAGRHLGVVKLLLEQGANFDAKQDRGFTPLHEAAHLGDKYMADMLIKAGADRSARNDAGETPADVARAAGHEPLAEILSQVP
jgi:uncharacterized protein